MMGPELSLTLGTGKRSFQVPGTGAVRNWPGDAVAVAVLVALPMLIFGVPALFGHPVLPGHAAGLHVHNGPVVGSILAGLATYQIEGQPASVLQPGDVFFEPEGERIARFDAGTDGVTFLAYFLLAPGQEPELTQL